MLVFFLLFLLGDIHLSLSSNSCVSSSETRVFTEVISQWRRFIYMKLSDYVFTYFPSL